MIIPSWASRELARPSTWTCAVCSSLTPISATRLAAQQRSLPQRHQRKHSSSKASSPPKEIPSTVAAPSDPANKSVAKEGRTPGEVSKASDKRSGGRASKRKTKENLNDESNRAENGAAMNLPYVQSTQNLHPLNVHLASFFSIHRPLSITHAIPPPAVPSAFSALFKGDSPSPDAITNVITTLETAAHDLEDLSNQQPPNMSAEESQLRSVLNQPSATRSSNSHDQGLPSKSLLLGFAKKFRPFNPPPPPVPMDALNEAAGDVSKALQPSSQPKRRSYKTTLTIYEDTHADGRRSYETHSSPLKLDPPVAENETGLLPWTQPRGQPFLGRMRERQVKYEDRVDERMGNGIWQLISVKRQRKLKMKKHKYKKLMKRTKNLRRRLDRV